MAWKLLLTGFLGWVGNKFWNKHGGKLAEGFPIVEKLGLAESPPTVIRRSGNEVVTRNIRDYEDD